MGRISHLLVDRVTVSRLAEVAKGSGRFTKELTDIATDVPFRIAPASAREVRDGEQMRSYVMYNGYCEAALDLFKDDVITVTKRSGVAIVGPRYRVVARLAPSLPQHLKVLLERIQRAVT